MLFEARSHCATAVFKYLHPVMFEEVLCYIYIYISLSIHSCLVDLSGKRSLVTCSMLGDMRETRGYSLSVCLTDNIVIQH